MLLYSKKRLPGSISRLLLSVLAGSLFAKMQFALEVEDWGRAAAEKWPLTSAVAVAALTAEDC